MLCGAGAEVVCALADETTQHRKSNIRLIIIGKRLHDSGHLLPQAVEEIRSRVGQELLSKDGAGDEARTHNLQHGRNYEPI